MSKLYKVEFYAELSEDDVRAMNKYFFETMTENMAICSLSGLQINPVDEPEQSKLETLLLKPFKHMSDIRVALGVCKSASDVEKVLEAIPAVFGSFNVEYDNANEGFTVCNSFYDPDADMYEDEIFWVEYADGFIYPA